MPAGLMAAPPAGVPASADLARMRRDRVERLRGQLQAKGLDALVLLGNTNVVYATGAVWPLADAGRDPVRRSGSALRRQECPGR